MEKIAFIFPGQGSQYVCMGKGYHELYEGASKTFEEANDILGYDLSSLCFEGPQDELDRTENTQPALLASSIAVLRVLKEKIDLTPSFLAGHSLGEYTALVASGSLEFEDALRIVHLRGKFMQESVPEGTGMMCAVLGLGSDVVAGVCSAISDERKIVVPANINSPEQIVISGHAEAVEKAAEVLKDKGAKKVVPLKVSAPSHSPLMKPAADRLKSELEKVTFKDLSVPVITNVEAEPLVNAGKVKELLVKQLTSPVKWVDIIKRMRAAGTGLVIEVGPGKVLTGLARRIDRDLEAMALDDPAGLEKALKTLKGVAG